MSEQIDIIGGLIDWLKEQDSSFEYQRGASMRGYVATWFLIHLKSPSAEYALGTGGVGQITLVWPSRIPPGLQYDAMQYDEHGPYWGRKEWPTIHDGTIFDEILETARSLRDGKQVLWHKIFRNVNGKYSHVKDLPQLI
jgi:hypothetical protein